MSGYIIANVQVTNPTQYEEYKKWSTAAMQSTGAEVCVRGGKVEVLEGDWSPSRIVLFEFPDMASARALFTSEDYAPLKALRQSCSTGHAVVVEGL